jgi:hypothetical protein
MDTMQGQEPGEAPKEKQIAIAIGFDGPDAEKVITARQIEAKALRTYRSIV